MMANRLVIFLSLTLVSLTCLSPAQESEELLDSLLNNLKINILAPLHARGLETSNQQRAMYIGYILNRQAQFAGNFETDRLLMQKLQQQVRDFLNDISSDPDMWSNVENGMAGKYNNDMEQTKEGAPYIEPIFTSLGTMLENKSALDLSHDRYYAYPNKNEIIRSAQDFFYAFKEKRYADTRRLTAGKFADEWARILEEAHTVPKRRQELESLGETLEWKLFSSTLADSQPPVAHIVWGIAEPGANWFDYDMWLILDAGTWRIVEFKKQ